MTSRDIQVTNKFNTLAYSKKKLNLFFKTLDSLKDYPIPNGELSIAFIDDNTIAQLHDDFLNDPSPTDVITFPPDPELDFAGEICVSVDHAITYSQKNNVPFATELALYLVHGWLHLAGFDDLNDHDRSLMRLAEKDVLSLLQNANAIPDFHLV